VHKLCAFVSCVAALSACGGGSSHHSPDASESGGGDASVPIVPGADPTFGDGGLVTIGFPGGIAGLMRVARQSDGKIVGVGATQEALLIARVNSDGTFDTSFAQTGVLQLPMGVATNGVLVGYGCAIQPDGKIVAAARVLGSYSGLTPLEIVVRLLPDGTLDTSFAQTGMFIGAKGTGAQALALDSSGNVLVGGFGKLDRLLPDGTRDTSFGTAGTASVMLNPIDLAIQSDGKIVAIGGRSIARFSSTGAVDTAFGTNGIITVPGVSYDQLYSLAIESDGKILVGGAITPMGANNQDYWIGRFSATGAADTGFGTNGVVAGNGTSGGLAVGVGVDPSGNVVGGGYFVNGSAMGRTARFTAAGALDPTFGAGGIGPADTYNISFSNSLAFEPNGTVTSSGAGLDPASFAYHVMFTRTTAAGTADASFGTGGVATRTVGGSFDRAQAVAFQPDGKVLVGGWAYSGGNAVVVRLNHDGSLDTSFGKQGVLTESRNLNYVNAIAVQPTGNILVSGVSGFGAGGKRQFVVERFDASGQVDMTFGNMGVAGGAITAGQDAVGVNMAIAPDGSIVLVGQTVATGTTFAYGVMELTQDGAPTAFGTSGVALTTFASSTSAIATHAVVQADGSVVVLGMVGTTPTLVRYAPNGTQDSAFGTVAMPTMAAGLDPAGLALEPDGSILAVAGNYFTGDLEIARYTAAGVLDPSFGTAGVFATKYSPNDYYGLYSFYGVTVLPSGEIQIGFAQSTADTLNENGTLLRLHQDGTTDESYGPGGLMPIAIGRGSTSINALAVDADGKLLVVGRTWTESGGSDYMAMRFVP
jgi:uncharacterized delta-60 repeat protein